MTIPLGVERTTNFKTPSGKIASSKKSKILERMLQGEKSEYIFKGENYPLILNAEDKAAKPEQLMSLKKALDEINASNKLITQPFKPTKAAEVLFIKYINETEQYFRFYAFKRDYAKAVTGVIFGDVNMAENIKQIITQIYSSISFSS